MLTVALMLKKQYLLLNNSLPYNQSWLKAAHPSTSIIAALLA